jgi:hypothetical protein
MDGDVRAIAMAGSWSATGIFIHPDRDYFSFACLSAVVAKCEFWGYGNVDASTTGDIVMGTGPVTVSNHDLMQACTRMARADICGDGEPKTRDGTTINPFEEFTSISVGSPLLPHSKSPPAGFEFEAAWRAGRQGEPAVCAGKLRWAGLRFNACANLKDPRTHPRSKDLHTDFCENYDEILSWTGTPPDPVMAAMEKDGALLFNRSRFLDAGLWTWIIPTPAGSFPLTTTMLIDTGLDDAGHGQPPEWRPGSTPLPPELSLKSLTGGLEQFQGSAFTPALTGTTGKMALWNFRSSRGDFFTDVLPPSTPPSSIMGYSPFAFEGYIFADSSSTDTVPLVRYRNTSTGLYWTTTSMPGAPWTADKTLGWVIHASTP